MQPSLTTYFFLCAITTVSMTEFIFHIQKMVKEGRTLHSGVQSICKSKPSWDFQVRLQREILSNENNLHEFYRVQKEHVFAFYEVL